MAYTFYISENSDSYDYMFYASATQRMYTVTFDSTLYSNEVEELPTLLHNGYGVLFYFNTSIKGTVKQVNLDPQVSETIQNIFMDFFQMMGDDTFIVYQCEQYKQRKLFEGWYNCVHSGKTVAAGLEMQAADAII